MKKFNKYLFSISEKNSFITRKPSPGFDMNFLKTNPYMIDVFNKIQIHNWLVPRCESPGQNPYDDISELFSTLQMITQVDLGIWLLTLERPSV